MHPFAAPACFPPELLRRAKSRRRFAASAYPRTGRPSSSRAGNCRFPRSAIHWWAACRAGSCLTKARCRPRHTPCHRKVSAAGRRKTRCAGHQGGRMESASSDHNHPPKAEFWRSARFDREDRESLMLRADIQRQAAKRWRCKALWIAQALPGQTPAKGQHCGRNMDHPGRGRAHKYRGSASRPRSHPNHGCRK